MQSCRLDELNYDQVKANPLFDVAVLPLGASYWVQLVDTMLGDGTVSFGVAVVTVS